MAEADLIQSFGVKRNANDTRDAPSAGEIKVDQANLIYGTFPEGFLFGCGTSAVQIEGGWDSDGKGPSVWDKFCIERPEGIEDGSNCFVTCDSYNKYNEDVRVLKQIGCNSYKLSISWPRILPEGDLSVINQKGIDYYNKLIDALVANGIEPVVVLWHFDLPANLKLCWKNEEIVNHFVNYARICFKSFGDRVKIWMTLNEPWLFTMGSYDLGLIPPFESEPEVLYVVLFNMLKAHALAYRMYEKEFKNEQKGKVGISLDCWGLEPATDSEADKHAVKRAFQFKFGILASPLVYGKYPDVVKETIDALSIAEGRDKSRLPEIDSDLSKILKGSVDFFGLNHYTCLKVSANGKDGVPEGTSRILFSKQTSISLSHDEGSFQFFDPTWPGSLTWWLKFTPHALRPFLRMIKESYGDIELMITENGIPDKIGTVEDIDRASYFTSYVNETLKSIKLDECNVTGYFAWGLLDQWEWITGFGCTFGLVHIDPNDPEKKRRLKYSAGVLKQIYNDKGFLHG